MYFTVIALLILTFNLIGNFKKDKGLNRKAKVAQTIMLLTLVTFFAEFVENLIFLILNFDSVNYFYSADVGVLSGQVNQVLYYVGIAYQMFVLVLLFFLSNRNNTARVWLMWLLPFWVFTYLVNYYRNIANRGQEFGVDTIVILIPAFILMLGLSVVYIVLYNRKFMKYFFDQGKKI